MATAGSKQLFYLKDSVLTKVGECLQLSLVAFLINDAMEESTLRFLCVCMSSERKISTG